MEIKVIKLGNFKVDADKNFHYLDPTEEFKGIKLAIQPYVIRTKNDTVLLDAGLGMLHNNEPLLINQLKNEQIASTQISKILISHLHKDHCGGLAYFKDNTFIPNFPNATIYIQQREYEYALQQTDSKSYDLKFLTALKDLPNIVWLHADEGSISSEITYKITKAHAPYHQVFWIQDQQHTLFYGADDLPTTGHLKRAIAFKTDFNGSLAMQLRKEWQQQATTHQWLVLFYHDMKTPYLAF